MSEIKDFEEKSEESIAETEEKTEGSKSSEEEISEDSEEKKEEDKKGRTGKKVKPPAVWKIVVVLVLVFVFTFFLTGTIWALFTWSSISMDELLWHLHGSLDGANSDMVWQFVLITVGSGLLVTGGAFFMNWMVRKRRNVIRKRIYRITQILAAVLLVGALTTGWIGFGIGDYIKYQMTREPYIADNYVDPASVEITFPEKKRNLIVIYMESMEMTFSDKEHGGAFEKNVIADLTQLAEEDYSENFSGNSGILNGGIALPGAIWTMGALFGTTAGLPLKTPLGQNGMGANKDFFPGVITMGDILKKEGYQNRMIMGSDVNFGGCRKYFESHGDYVIHDYIYAKEIGLIDEDYKVWWGYEDEKLFAYAKDELQELAAGDQPFSLVLQTMDTHFEDGHSCPLCHKIFGDNKYANVMDCSSRMVRRFVEWLRTQDFYENTTIVITGDHPTMDTDFCDDVPEEYQRKVFTCIVNGAAEVKDPDKVRVYSTFDLFPTILAAMGVEIEGDRLGLGANLYSDVPTLTERDSVETVEEKMNCRSPLMVDMFYGNYEHPAAGGK